MKNIKKIVAKLYKDYGTLDPFELCECLNIKVIKCKLGGDIKGICMNLDNDQKIIFIDSEINEYEMKYVCAHELGHILLHNTVSLGFLYKNSLLLKNKYEIEADKFAAELLIDLENIDYAYSELNLQQLSSRMCVPLKLMEYKLSGATQVASGMIYN